jgi:phage terminase large subunit-like protein
MSAAPGEGPEPRSKPKRRMATRSKRAAASAGPAPFHNRTDAELERLCRENIPEYDPWAGVEGRYAFDAVLARRALGFFHDVLVFVEGERAGEPFHLEPWQAAIVGNLFGWVDPRTRVRRYREALVFVARRNGKTSLAAGIALYLLLCDDEPGAQVYSAAADRDQAALLFRHASEMVMRHPSLSRRCRVYRAFKSLEVAETGSIFRALSSDAHTKHGLSVHGAVIDELHAHPTRDLVDVLQTGTGSRRQPLVLHITTADYERESICNEKYAYAKKVRDGVFGDLSFLPVVYEASADDDWEDPATWRKANPNLGVSVNEEYLRRECDRARESPAYLNTFLRLHLNLRTNADVAWLDMRQWDACAGPDGFRTLEQELEGQECYGGLDLASTDDLTALVLFFPGAENAVLPYFWCPRDNAVVREKRHRVPYTQWARDGYLTLTPGNYCDLDAVEAAILDLSRRYRIREIAFDRFGAAQVTTHLHGAGLEVVPFGQGYLSLSAPAKHLDVLVRSGNLRHGGHPVLRWMASNVMLEKDAADNWKPSKRRSREKIDGIVGACMAIGRAIVQPAPVTDDWDWLNEPPIEVRY